MDIRIVRTFDVSVCVEIISNPEIWEVISEDTATLEGNIPDVVNDIWLAVYNDNILIGVCRFHQKWLNTVQGHIQILKKYREFSIDAGKCIIEWIVNNTEYKNVYTEVPSIYSNVINFLKMFDFKESGKIRDCYTKDQKLTDIVILTRELN